MSPERASHLISEYATTHCEAAFRELVDAYAGMVMAVATRAAHGDWALARDASQTVFVALARRPRAIKNGGGLGAWLHRVTVRQVLQMVRSDQRRRQREAHALVINEPEASSTHSADLQPGVIASSIDLAMNQIREADRRILTLRYFEMKDWKSIAGTFLLTEDAVQKRASRALDRLRRLLAGREVHCSAAAMVGALTLPSAHSADLASRIASQAIAAAARPRATWPSFLTKTALLMTTKAKLTVLAGALMGAFFGAGYLTGTSVANNNPPAGARQNPGAPMDDGRVRPESRQEGRIPKMGTPEFTGSPAGVVSDSSHVAVAREMADKLAKGRLFGGPNGRLSRLSEEAVALLGEWRLLKEKLFC
jgi:RNA polymerase sigma factor (sigma-70 family)